MCAAIDGPDMVDHPTLNSYFVRAGVAAEI